MASISRRGKAWRAFVRRCGVSKVATFDTKREAQDWAAGVEAALRRPYPTAEGAIVQPASALEAAGALPGPTLAALFDRYAAEVSPHKKGARWERVRLRAFGRVPELAVPASSFTATEAAAWRDRRLHQVSAYTVNRELNLISAVFNQAVKEWRVARHNPIRDITRPRNPKDRTKRVSAEERRAICEALGWDQATPPASTAQWTAFAFCVGLETAMRRGEICSLRWRDLHLVERFAHLTDTKNGDSRDVPLSSMSIELFKILPPRGADNFVVPASPAVISALFGRAKKSAGLSIRFHDSRREALTTMSKKLSNVLELAAVSGHRSLRSLQTYYRPKASELAEKLR